MIVVGCTLAAVAMSDYDTWSSWLKTAEEIRETYHDVRFFAAIETDGRGLEPFAPLLERLSELGGSYWTFSLDDGRTEVTTANRLRHIVAGQNFVAEYAVETGATHLLLTCADCQPPGDVLPKLLEVNHPIVGGEVPAYCMTGTPNEDYEDFPVVFYCAPVALVLLRRDILTRIKFRYDPDNGMTDDPCLTADCADIGWRSMVRKDVVGKHFPERLPPLEHRDYLDRTVVR